MPPVDHTLVARLTNVVQDRLVAETTARLTQDRPALDDNAQTALAMDVIATELRAVDSQRIASGHVRLDEAAEEQVTQRVLALAVGLGPPQMLLANPDLEELVATRFDLLFGYYRGGDTREIDERVFGSEAEMEAWLSLVARTRGRTERSFNSQTPMLVMQLGEGSGLRLSAMREVSQHVSFTLRRNTLGKVSLGDLVGLGMMPAVIAEFLMACVHAPEIRLVICGATNSGKSTLSRALLGALGPLVRVIIIEDTAELELFDPVTHPNVESWEQRLPNNEGEGGITQGMLVKQALRYRPDYLTVGEVRDSDAAVPFLKAGTHGQASLTTVHSASAVGALDKLALYLATGEDRLPPDVAHNQLAQAIDFIVHVDRDPTGHRMVDEVIEVSGFDGKRCTTNTIMTRDRHGEPVLTQRLTERHTRVLQRAGFDDSMLGGGFR